MLHGGVLFPTRLLVVKLKSFNMDLPLLLVCSPTSTLLYPTKPQWPGWCAASRIKLPKTSSNLLVPSSSQLCSATTSPQCPALLYPSLTTCSVQPTECDNRYIQKPTDLGVWTGHASHPWGSPTWRYICGTSTPFSVCHCWSAGQAGHSSSLVHRRNIPHTSSSFHSASVHTRLPTAK